MMNRNTIGALLFRAKKLGTFFVDYKNSMFTVDELLSMLQGREVDYFEAMSFLNSKTKT